MKDQPTGIITLPQMTKAEMQAFKYGWELHRELQNLPGEAVEVNLKYGYEGAFGLKSIGTEKLHFGQQKSEPCDES